MAKKSGATGGSQTGLRESFGNSKKADWIRADAAQLQETIAAVAKTGGALRLGYSRDGGAYAIGVYGDGTANFFNRGFHCVQTNPAAGEFSDYSRG